MTSDFPCSVDGRDVSARIGADELFLSATAIAYVDVDDVTVAGARVTLGLADGRRIEISRLAKRFDEFVADLRAARARSRRSALLQWTAEAPIDVYPTVIDGEPGQVVLFDDGITVEPLNGPPHLAPLSLIEHVERDGYTITLHLRGTDALVLRALGRRTDELLLDLDRARNALAERTAAAYASLGEQLIGYTAPDGWALTAAEAGQYWAPLRAVLAASAGEALEEGEANPMDVLADLAGAGLRLGIKEQGHNPLLPFALAPVGDRVAIEGFGEESRATYVFRGDADWVNVVLLLTSFRREAFYLPDGQLGRWAVAVRTLGVVREARSRLVARIVHDATWAAKLTAALRN